ncbi:MAG TPA: UDP-N-acetylmuramoyl-L-alanyl-D-glutamate--2,6-diaminopimelate ligase [Pyrinomonadaceae bacterium]|nr:UDP-N-acetylmuramoyl-L-alanyl-D-glutamate--2,6-diaminopimelate ligase [Pyrinomonadaceae bacterium]
MSDKIKRRRVTLGDVARAVNGRLTGDEDREVAGVTHDSRQVGEGSLFVAIRGARVDAHRFVDQVMASGAIGIISERTRPENFASAWLEVRDARRALALAAAEVYGHPSRELQLVGITGTNGKTTTSYLVASIAEAAGEPVAMIGTVEYRIGSERFKAERTTPEATDIQRFLRRAVEAGCRTAVMECSSQAIDFRRCDALHLSVAVFTNLTRDHLDHHGTMEAYFAAKRRLFDGSLAEEPPRASIINIDDAYGLELARDLKKGGRRVITYALGAEADVMAREVKYSLEGMRFHLRTPVGRRDLHSPLVGRPHVYNILAAVGSGLETGSDLDRIARAIETCTGAPGRFERVPHDGDFAVVVDYAHTEDALLNVLRTAREVAQGRIITVFGCGGDRDRTKRAPMGEAAASLSDIVILTSDNPRTEDPEAILADVEVGLRASSRPYQKIADRREAIQRAITEARAGDLVLIAGKGHEDYQIIGRDVFPFNDREVAREAIASKK